MIYIKWEKLVKWVIWLSDLSIWMYKKIDILQCTDVVVMQFQNTTYERV